MKLASIALAALVAAGCAKREGVAAAPEAALTPCRRHLACINRCADTPDKRRNPPAVRVCTEACEKSATPEALGGVRALRLCEYRTCGDVTVAPDDTPEKILRRHVDCVKEHCAGERAN